MYIRNTSKKIPLMRSVFCSPWSSMIRTAEWALDSERVYNRGDRCVCVCVCMLVCVYMYHVYV